jgi:O-antigen ligase
MYLLQSLIIFISIAAILLWVRSIDSSRYVGKRANLSAIVLAIWIIASAVLGPHFFALRFPGGFDITIERILFILILFILMVGLFVGKVNLRYNIKIEILMGLFALVCVLSMLRTGFTQSAQEFSSPWFVFITGYLFPFVVFIFSKNYIIDEDDVMVILHALYFFGIYLCITSIFEYANLRQFIFPRYIVNPDIGIHIDRARGPLLNAAFNGVGILVGFICGIHLLGKKTGLTRICYILSLLLFFPAIFFTLTRSVYLGLLIAVSILIKWYKTSSSKWKLISLPLTLVVIVGFINLPRFFSTDRRQGGVYQVEEVAIRMALIQQSIYLFSIHPFAGVGLAQFIPASLKEYKGRVSFIAESSEQQMQHNHLLGLAVELGAAGILPYMMIIIMIFRRLMQLTGSLPSTGILGKNMLIVIAAVWCVYLSNNFFVEPSLNLFLNAVPFIFAGIADGLYSRSLQSADGLQS